MAYRTHLGVNLGTQTQNTSAALGFHNPITFPMSSVTFSLRLTYGQRQKCISVAQAHTVTAEVAPAREDLPDKVMQATGNRRHV